MSDVGINSQVPDDSTQSNPRWRVGTMGFSYDDWRDVFYPRSLKPGEWLGFYARHFDCVEIDSTFHAVPAPERFERWADAVPGSFRFCVKTPRAITHESVIADVDAPMNAFLSAASHLGAKLAVVLIQFPPTLQGRVWPQVERFLDRLSDRFHYAVEFRHPTWFRDEVYTGLERRRIALVNAEYDFDPPTPVVTTDFTYLRLIGLHGRYEPMDHERVDRTERLAWWRDQLHLANAKNVWCIINNDYAGFSVATADKLRTLLGQRISSQQERLGVLF